MSDIILKVAGVEYTGWKDIRVERSLNQVAGAFGFSATDRYPGKPTDWNIRMGQECTVGIDNYILCTGYIDSMNIDYNSQGHTFSISGRDKTADLVDCSFAFKPYLWTGQTVGKVIKNLCSPFGISVTIHSSVATVAATIADDGSGKGFTVGEGNTAFESIIELCQMHAILPISYGDGKLTLTQAGTATITDQLELGKNILSGSFMSSNADRFSRYVAYGQGGGAPTKTGEDTNNCKGEWPDDIVTRERPLVILANNRTTSAQCKDRAKWEARVRAGKSRTLSYTVQGWLQSDGEPWPLNKKVKVKDTLLTTEDPLLIAGVALSLSDEEGSLTELSLVDPKAYELLAEPIDIKGAYDGDSPALAALKALRKQ